MSLFILCLMLKGVKKQAAATSHSDPLKEENDLILNDISQQTGTF